MDIRGRFAVAVVLLAGAPTIAHPQGRVVPPPGPDVEMVRAAPGPRYEAGTLHRHLLGEDWRILWTTPLTLPVLDLETFAGGLTPERAGGNRQSMTLHFIDASGRGWVFRSTDKYPQRKLGDELRDTPAGALIQDQISSQHPGGALMLPPMLEALGILHVEPMPYVMPDDPRLGEFRDDYAGMIGMIEAKPNEGPDDTPGFAGSRKLVDADKMLERLEESPEHAVDQREMLRARLFDFIINDTDRATDQWRFARFEMPGQSNRYLWRPLPRDRDFAFVAGDGLLAPLLRTIYPKLVEFGPEHASIEAHTFSAHILDRRLLTGLTRADFAAEAEHVRTRLADEAIQQAVDRLPPEYPEENARLIAASLRARRDALAGIADEFYLWLASEVDVRATDEPDRAEIVRQADGTVAVTLWTGALAPITASGKGGPAAPAEAIYYQRVFRPGETNEVRVFMHGGDDIATVRGGGGDIRIRVIGGGGDDVLVDASTAPGVHLYDDRGTNTLTAGPHTDVDTRAWDAPEAPEGVRFGSEWAPDWGDSHSWGPAFDFGEYGGLIVGVGPSWTDQGFRRLPYHWRLDLRALYALDAGRPGLELSGDYRFENSTSSAELLARWSGYDAFRWFGEGNDTRLVHEALSLVRVDRLSIEPALVWRTPRPSEEEPDSTAGGDEEPADPDDLAARIEGQAGGFQARLAVGPVLARTSTSAMAGSPFELERPLGHGTFWHAGGRVTVELGHTDGRAAPRSGYRLRGRGAAFPGILDAEGTFGDVAAELNGYVPLGGGPHLALRVGGIKAFGDYPAFDAAMIGGRATLRGFEFQRYAGDAAAYGGAELRIPTGQLTLLVRGRTGVFGLFDAGRVWTEGESPGGWHSAVGGGAWFEAFGKALSVAYAHGERGQVYFTFGLPY